MPVLLFLLWIVLNGRITVEIVAIGMIVIALVYLFMIRVFHWTLRRDLLLLRSLPIFLLYLLNLLREAAVAAVRVALLSFSPGKTPEPIIKEFNSGLGRMGLNVILANSITLTPGTITVRQEGDRFIIHALRSEYADHIENSSFVRLLRRFPR